MEVRYPDTGLKAMDGPEDQDAPFEERGGEPGETVRLAAAVALRVCGESTRAPRSEKYGRPRALAFVPV